MSMDWRVFGQGLMQAGSQLSNYLMQQTQQEKLWAHQDKQAEKNHEFALEQVELAKKLDLENERQMYNHQQQMNQFLQSPDFRNMVQNSVANGDQTQMMLTGNLMEVVQKARMGENLEEPEVDFAMNMLPPGASMQFADIMRANEERKANMDAQKDQVALQTLATLGLQAYREDYLDFQERQLGSQQSYQEQRLSLEETTAQAAQLGALSQVLGMKKDMIAVQYNPLIQSIELDERIAKMQSENWDAWETWMKLEDKVEGPTPEARRENQLQLMRQKYPGHVGIVEEILGLKDSSKQLKSVYRGIADMNIMEDILSDTPFQNVRLKSPDEPDVEAQAKVAPPPQATEAPGGLPAGGAPSFKDELENQIAGNKKMRGHLEDFLGSKESMHNARLAFQEVVHNPEDRALVAQYVGPPEGDDGNFTDAQIGMYLAYIALNQKER